MQRGQRTMFYRDVEAELQNDEDSDLDDEIDDADDKIHEVIDDYRELIQDVDVQDEKPKPEEQEVIESPVIRPSRAPSSSGGGRRVSALGRSRGHPGHVSESMSSGILDLRLMDEANGWSYKVQQARPDEPVYQEVIGLQIPFDENTSCLDCFKLFFNSDCVKLIKRETNRYAAQMKASLARKGQLKPNSYLASWTPVTESELKKFFAIIIHMSLVRKESMDSYWSTNLFVSTPFPRSVLSRQRFRAIYCCLHLNDNGSYIPRGETGYDAFFKLRPYFDMLVERCKNLLLPDENLTIDEGTCGFRGRMYCRVFDKDKPDKYGIKIYMLCEADTGYVLKMVPYIGDSKTVKQVVFELMEDYLDKWHTVYMDRFFSSPTIMDLLWLRQTRAVGTVMLTIKGLPKRWCQQNLEKNEMAFCHRGALTACKWKDKRDVCFLTTKHAATWTEVKVKARGGFTSRIKPDCVLDYNVNKVRVELNDQYVSYYSLRRKTMKWWKKIFFHLFFRGTVNAFIIYCKTRPPEPGKIKFSTYLERCGEALVEEAGMEDQPTGPSRSGPHGKDARLFGRHFVAPIPPTATKKKPYKVCKVCADIGKANTGVRRRKETSYHCDDCQVPLCIHPCFKKYHTQKDYTK